MMTRYEAWLDEKSLSSIDPAIYVLDIAYESPRYVMITSDNPGRDGQKVTSRYAQNTSVQVTFEIHEQDVARRQDVCKRVQAWAMKGGYLTTNDRRDQRLKVMCQNPPSITSVLKWTQPLKILFTAYEQPYWEEKRERKVTIDGTNASGSLDLPGIGAVARVEVDVDNTSGQTINQLTVGVDGTTMAFEDLGLSNGKTLKIDYDENGLLRIRVEDETKMQCRTAESSDELLANTGKTVTVSVSASRTVSATFKMRGLYM